MHAIEKGLLRQREGAESGDFGECFVEMTEVAVLINNGHAIRCEVNAGPILAFGYREVFFRELPL